MLVKLAILLCLELSFLEVSLALDARNVSQTLEIIRSRGFGGEEYHILSYDGYPLTVYHVINPLADQRTLNRFPVIIFHGLGGDAAQMISHSVDTRARKPVVGQLVALKGDDCLAFMLSNNNFDVWLIDSRGVNLNNRDASVDLNYLKSQQFWNFSLDEQTFNDAPRQIDFVLQQTQTSKAFVVTYSQSTFFLFALLSAVPEYAAKIASLVAMAPTVYVEHTRGLGMPLMFPLLLAPESVDGNYAPQPIVDTVGTTARRLCSIKLISTIVCKQVSQVIAGKQESNNDAEDFFSTLAMSSSIRVLKHFVQLHLQKRFGMYDYGQEGNMLKYGQPAVPNYDLGRVILPTIIIVRGANDFLSGELDQERLIRELGVRPLVDIKLPKYNHLDFILNENVFRDVNTPIAQIFTQITLGDTGSPETPIRDPLRPVPVQAIVPDDTVEPLERPGFVVNTQVHTVKNLVDGLELKPKLDLLLSQRQSGRVTQGLEIFADSIDRLTGTLNSIPDLVQAPIVRAHREG